MQVFKTEGCGWGVRSTAAIETGTVLGIYTGWVFKHKSLTSAERPSFAERYCMYPCNPFYIILHTDQLFVYCSRRKDVKYALDAAQGYLFDLDGHEQDGGNETDDDEGNPRYSVNSYMCGSCSIPWPPCLTLLIAMCDGRELDPVYQVGICITRAEH